MNGKLKPICERLVLDRDKNEEIFVESMLHQHHIDGIRFLYKQFKKKQLGVIINNPLGYGNSLQVALFLGAVQHLLDKPILILCEQSKELEWLEHFQKRMQTYNVVIAAENPFIKKTIFINTMERLDLFCRRHWSVMVVDNDSFLNEKKLQNKFVADYKIWITPVDMKEHLDTFFMIYQWLYPKEKLNINDFKPKNRVQTLTQRIQLEYFLQDVVFRTTLLTPFENTYEKLSESPNKVSKKNKDVTGTKIKRSKRILEDSNNISNSTQNAEHEAGVSAVKIPRIKIKTTNSTDSLSVSDVRCNKVENDGDIDDKSDDVESFIRNKEPIKCDAFKDYIQEFDNISYNSQDGTEFKDEESGFEVEDNVKTNFDSEKVAENLENYSLDSDSDSHMRQVNEEIRSQDSNDSVYEAETQKMIVDVKTAFNDDDNETIGDIKVDENSNDNNEKEFKINSNEFQNKIDTNGFEDYEIKNENSEVSNTKKVDRNDRVTQNIVNEYNNFYCSENKSHTKVNCVNEESTKTKESKKNDLDSKITEQMDKAMKKFKGSLLDSIF